MSGSANNPVAVTMTGVAWEGTPTSSCTRRCALDGALQSAESAHANTAARARPFTLEPPTNAQEDVRRLLRHRHRLRDVHAQEIEVEPRAEVRAVRREWRQVEPPHVERARRCVHEPPAPRIGEEHPRA